MPMEITGSFGAAAHPQSGCLSGVGTRQQSREKSSVPYYCRSPHICSKKTPLTFSRDSTDSARVAPYRGLHLLPSSIFISQACSNHIEAIMTGYAVKLHESTKETSRTNNGKSCSERSCFPRNSRHFTSIFRPQPRACPTHYKFETTADVSTRGMEIPIALPRIYRQSTIIIWVGRETVT